ncbi:hypothetical protein [Nocardiopsis lambiniae]|uniref:Uncharacterized protein n=1 Tax=Nocardiopsis lambiniae TaxID=3075539 RepID=A0ABU2M8R2_9ACTN|nr:hypothetical protein [Nocardiopsis sp. DSM 44743]MDT0329063.1 hypothetical protein [Nocardiopsis sp. DSM 44743]
MAHTNLQFAAIYAGGADAEVTEYALPSRYSFYSEEGDKNYGWLPEDVKAAFAEHKNGNQILAKANEDNSTALVDKKKSNQISDDDFDKAVDRQKEENKEKYNKSQDDLAAKLKKAKNGKTNEQRGGILSALQDVSNALVNLWEKVKNFLDKLAQALQDAVQWIVNAWNEVKNWFAKTFG